MSKLLEEIANMKSEVARQSIFERIDVSVYYIDYPDGHSDGFPDAKPTDDALRSMHDDQLLYFLEQFMKYWFEANSHESAQQEIYALLGRNKLAEVMMGHRLMFTLSGNGRQFRVWYGVPGRVHDHNHVDSCGRGLLFDIRGPKEKLEKVIDRLVSPHQQRLVGVQGTVYWL